MKILQRINWVNTLFLTIVPVVGIVGTVLFSVFGLVHWPTWVLMGGFVLVSGLSITGGYHRLFAHNSYQAAWPLRLMFVLFGAACFQGSVLEWCTDHRKHHRYTDTDKDPYSIKKGFWYAHVGWLFVLDTNTRDFSNVADLAADPIVRFQHRFYIPIAVLMGFGLPTGIAALWGDPLGGLIIAGALCITLNHHFTFCINSVCHFFGTRTYSDQQSARDNWVTALFTYGEGFHNFHHQFPVDYRNGIRAYDFDPTKWLIRGMSFIGLAKGLKKVGSHRIVQYKIRMDHKRLLQISQQGFESLLGQLGYLTKPVYEKMQHVLSRIEELESGYAQLKKTRFNTVAGKMNDYQASLAEYRVHLKQARRELKRFLTIWAQLVRHNLKKPAILDS